MARILLAHADAEGTEILQLFEPLTRLGHVISYLPFSQSIKGIDLDRILDADAVVFLYPDDKINGGDNTNNILYTIQTNANSFNKNVFPVFRDSVTSPNPANGPGLTLSDPDLVQKIHMLIVGSVSKPGEAFSDAAQSGQATNAGSAVENVFNDENYGSSKYWLIKIDPQNWNIANFKIGYQASYNRYERGDKLRIDDANFYSIKKGDRVLGFAFGDKKAIECVFDVSKGNHRLHENGDGISLIITGVFKPAIPLELASAYLPFKDKLDGSSRERLFPVTKEAFDAITVLAEALIEQQEQYIGSYTTEGNHEATEDHLAFEYDIESFGAVICLKTVKPPLAIGLFGKWGSGKSFFMQKLGDYIDKLAASADERYVQSIVQVKFNSWHYSDSNLWASLITDIFDSLNTYATGRGQEDEIKKLSDALQLTGLQKLATEQQKQALQATVDNLQQQQKEKNDRLEEISGIKLLKQAVNDKQIQNDLSNLNGGIKTLIENKNKLTDYITAVKSFGSQANLFLTELKDFSAKRWLWLLVSAFFVFILAFLIISQVSTKPDSIVAWLSLKSALIFGVAGKIVEAIKKYRDTLANITDRLGSLKKTLDSEAYPGDPRLTSLEKELADLTGSLTVLDKKITDTQQQITDISSGKRLMEFISSRSRDENYTRQLGLISLIRKDFETLDKLLREQHQVSGGDRSAIVNSQGVTLNIDRIVLYIDDLDRCNEEIVVKVLEAIHLLLAFPLFVVVVGVDPRWLNNALNKKYSTLFQHHLNQPDEESNGSVREPITSYDYLEKIFQIPFALKPVSNWNRKQLLRYLLRDEVLADPQAAKSTGRNTPPAKIAGEKAVPPAIELQVSQDPIKTVGEAPAVVDKAQPVRPGTDPVKFTKDEIDFMEHISGMFGHTPRTINRYVNIYRIIKSHRSYRVTLTKTQIDYKATMFLLALILGCPDEAQIFIDQLQLRNDINLQTFTNNLQDEALKRYILKYLDEETLKLINVDMFRKNLHLVARFSFRTHLLDDSEQA